MSENDGARERPEPACVETIAREQMTLPFEYLRRRIERARRIARAKNVQAVYLFLNGKSVTARRAG